MGEMVAVDRPDRLGVVRILPDNLKALIET
jgi:hypothetical protein